MMRIKAALYDTVGFLRKLRPAKLRHAIKLTASWYLSAWRREPFHSGMPVTLSIEPTTACNLQCPECPSGLRTFTRPVGNIDVDFYKNLIDDTARHLMYLIFYFQGEPYIHPAFLEMVHYAHKKNIYTISSTNGHFLNRENALKTVRSGLDRLIVSIDGTTQESYEQYRVGGELLQVLSGVENIMEAKKELKSGTPYVILQFLVVRHNQHQIEDMKKLAKHLRADRLVFKTAQVYDYIHGNPLIPTLHKYSRYEPDGQGKYKLKRKYSKPKQCWKMWHSAVISWDGKVLPCCFDKDAHYEMGNISATNRLKDIWQNGKYSAFRKKLSKGRSDIDICSNCSEGVRVWR